ncbi:alpha/beta-hydrolase [Rhizodiscina lignyota]|uniref:Alpha/beta-hydrolase n=1 Tax=Rhizodiscina lignyota TaxID=1504668 RepID=A0A9P4ICJ4_9PEZI|nr:alpha/beta-hydrolase [Rhizodiscina lignyota]
MASKPTLILVHGAWHGPDCWNLHVTPLLESRGYKTLVPTLPFCHTESPQSSIKPDIDLVANLIESEVSKGRDVLVVNHSLGGYVGCSAVKGFTRKDPSRLQDGWGKVIGIIQIVSFLPETGKALMDVSPIRFHLSHPNGWATIPHEVARKNFYNDLPQEEQDEWLDKMTLQSDATLEGPGGRQGVYAGWMDVPVWFLVCTLDQGVPKEVQEGMIAAARERGADFTAGEVQASHSPFLSKPRETVAFIVKAAEALAGSG